MDLDRFEASSDEGELAEVTCEITGSDALDDVAGSVTAIHGTPKGSDYSITVVFVDGGGIGRGEASAFIERVRPNEPAKSELFVTTTFADDLTCAVGGVERTASL